ncbi:MAG: hypothetical protein CME06_05390 [Gemmatimonadetes bacterium]|nr:hypothetical protein [Gemmatimonadota bacterium]
MVMLSRVRLAAFIDALRRHGEVVAPRPVLDPQASGEYRRYEELRSGELPELAPGKPALLPASHLFLPPRETMLSYELESGRFTEVLDREPRVVIGVPPCEAHALALLDQALSQGVPDRHYRARRENATVVSLACAEPCWEQCFCRQMGTHRATDGFDLLLTPIDAERFTVETNTEKGDALTAELSGVFAPALDADRAALDSWNVRCDAAFGPSESWSADPRALVEDGADDPVWSTEAERCLSCGACVLLCPTCTCFDMVESVPLPCSAGTRERCRDGCMIPGFSAVAHGADFRSDRAERLRHRTRRKFAYQPERYGGGSYCVGCGRCHAHCPVDIGPIGLLKELEKDREEAR